MVITQAVRFTRPYEFRRAAIFALALSMLLGGGGWAQDASRTLTVAIPSEPPTLDATDNSSVQQDVSTHIYRGLFTFDENSMPQPDLVTEYSVSDDQRTWTFHLEDGVTFFDGTPLNAEAVRYTIERMLDPDRGAAMAVLFSPIVEVHVVDDLTVELVTAQPFASLPNNLAHANAGIISPSADQELGDSFGRAPVSAGPYKVESWSAGNQIVLTRFEGFKGERPFFDRIVYRIVPTTETRLAMLETGEADVAIRMPATLLSQVEANPDLAVTRLDGTRVMYFWINLDRPPFDDVEVRRALNLAIDRDLIIERVLYGAGAPADSLVGSVVSYSTPVGTLEYDPDEARRILEERGLIGQEIHLVATEGNYDFDRQVAEAVAGFLNEVGLRPTLEIMSDVGAYNATMAERRHDLGMVAWGGSTADPDQYLRRQLWGGNARKPWNFAGYANPEVDALIELGAATFDPTARAAIYADIQQRLWNDWPFLLLHKVTSFTFTRADIRGVSVFLGGQTTIYKHAWRDLE